MFVSKMAKLSCVLLLLAAAATINANRIIGGNPTTIEDYPGMVQIEVRIGIIWTQSCAANILTTRYLLSVAHCFDGVLYNIRNRRVRAGAGVRNTGGNIHNIDRALNHPTYGRRGMDGDVSVLRLSSALVYSDRIRPISIPPQGYQIPDNEPVVHVGWGSTTPGGDASPILNDLQVNSINREICTARYASTGGLNPQRVTENMICAGILDEGGKGVCVNDSGGPLYYNGVLVGLISWIRECADPYYPGVSTAVSSYTDWIVANVV